MKPSLQHLKSTACATAIVLSMLVGSTQAQQVPIPTTPAEVPGPPPGTNLSTAYVQTVARAALVSWHLLRGPVEMSPACRSSKPTSRANVSKSCATCFLISARWQSWPTLAVPTR